jgi:hypothetical protein
MSRYRIHRIKKAPSESFRWSAHTGGLVTVKPKDYDIDIEVDAATPYGVWKTVASQGADLRPGDILEVVAADGASGNLCILKYIGFEPAEWFVPEAKGERVSVTSDFAPVSSAPNIEP